MDKGRKYDLFPAAMALLGAAGWLLRSGLYRMGVDGKNLLVRGHPLELGLWALTALAAVLALAAAFRTGKQSKYDGCFSASLAAAFGHILAASGILLTVLTRRPAAIGLLATLWQYSGLLSVPALYWAGFSRARGKRPFFGTYGVCSIFFALHLVAHYQLWCADPQLQNYVFAFLGVLCLMMAAYQHCAFCVDNGNSRLLRLFGLLGGYLCLVAVANGGMLPLYGGCAAWALTGLCSADPPGKKAGDAHDPA